VNRYTASYLSLVFITVMLCISLSLIPRSERPTELIEICENDNYLPGLGKLRD